MFSRGKLRESQNIITTSKSHWNEIVKMAVDACRPTDVLRVGGLGKKVSYPVDIAPLWHLIIGPSCLLTWVELVPCILCRLKGKYNDLYWLTITELVGGLYN